MSHHPPGRRVLWFIGLALAVLAAGAVLSPSSRSAVASDRSRPPLQPGASQQAVPPGPTDVQHYKCWTVLNQRVRPQIAFLQDQFDIAGVPGTSAPTHETVAVGRPDWFCNPARKLHGEFDAGISDPNDHLTCYQIKDIVNDPHASRAVLVSNQFGLEQTLKVGRPRDLCVPTQKLLVDGDRPTLGGDPPSDDLDHYKCYDVKGQAPKEPAKIQDQFDFAVSPTHFEEVRVVDPVLLCNPTRKYHVLGFDAAGNVVAETAGIHHRESHLVCYRIVKPEQLPHKLTISNQFGREQQIATRQSDMLCVPSFKKLISVGGVDTSDDDNSDTDDRDDE